MTVDSATLESFRKGEALDSVSVLPYESLEQVIRKTILEDQNVRFIFDSNFLSPCSMLFQNELKRRFFNFGGVTDLLGQLADIEDYNSLWDKIINFEERWQRFLAEILKSPNVYTTRKIIEEQTHYEKVGGMSNYSRLITKEQIKQAQRLKQRRIYLDRRIGLIRDFDKNRILERPKSEFYNLIERTVKDVAAKERILLNEPDIELLSIAIFYGFMQPTTLLSTDKGIGMLLNNLKSSGRLPQPELSEESSIRNLDLQMTGFDYCINTLTFYKKIYIR